MQFTYVFNENAEFNIRKFVPNRSLVICQDKKIHTTKPLLYFKNRTKEKKSRGMYYMMRILLFMTMVQFNQTNNNNCNSDGTIIVNFFFNPE